MAQRCSRSLLVLRDVLPNASIFAYLHFFIRWQCRSQEPGKPQDSLEAMKDGTNSELEPEDFFRTDEWEVFLALVR
ncbi:hypothetical protein AV530_012729 [Patagioenas fasciata monilis]|uniref:Uncharacterized protein n=1 Tax=Patagioenas fasciata monilis TaxID=372326 RepID=A0A1V4JDB7_PATFA|nr:hypothetical protein AV530_012729 [Patagioenas fasciata monilis]